MAPKGGTYRAEHQNLTGYVKAYNKDSADAQMKWVQENKTCFCETCVDKLGRDYSVFIEASSAHHTISQVLPRGVHAV